MAEQFCTEKGELCWVTIVGEGKENMNGDKMEYLASLRFKNDASELANFKEKINAFWEENKPGHIDEMKSNGIRLEKKKSDETGKMELTGYSVITAKTGTTWADGKPKIITVHNAAGTKVDMRGKLIGNESIGFISGAMDVYEVKPKKGKSTQAGIALYLNAVQLTKFVEYTGSAMLATPEEDGWMGEDEETGFTPQPEEDAAEKPPLKL